VSFDDKSNSPSPGLVTNLSTTGNIGVATGIDGLYVPICPGVLRVRCAAIFQCYAQYKIQSVRLKHIPKMTGIVATTSLGVDATGVVNYAGTSGNHDVNTDWTAAVGWVRDPAFSDTFSVDEVIQSGGKIVNMSKPWSITIKPKCGWFFQTIPSDSFALTSESGTLRTQFCGQLNMIWNDVANLPITRSATNTGALYVSTGKILAMWKIKGRYPIDPDSLGLSPSPEKRMAAIQKFTTLRCSNVEKRSDLRLLKSDELTRSASAVEHDDEKSDNSTIVIVAPPKKLRVKNQF